MTPLVAVWIDHEKAVVAFVHGDDVRTKTLHSNVPPHGRWAGAQDGGGEKKYEERHALRLQHFYDDVLEQFGDAQSLFFFGPGEAKRELQDRLARVHRLKALPLKVEAADRLTDAQIVARVKNEAIAVRRREP